MACHRHVITSAHTYSSGINLYCSACQTSFLSTNSVAHLQLHRIWSHHKCWGGQLMSEILYLFKHATQIQQFVVWENECQDRVTELSSCVGTNCINSWNWTYGRHGLFSEILNINQNFKTISLINVLAKLLVLKQKHLKEIITILWLVKNSCCYSWMESKRNTSSVFSSSKPQNYTTIILIYS